MTAATSNINRTYEIGNRNQLPIASSTTVIYEGTACGLIDGTGNIRLLVAGDRFVGFAEEGSNVFSGIGFAALSDCRLIYDGKISLSVTGVVVTDVGQPVYATDDSTFSMSPVAGSFIGRVHRFVSAGVAIVEFAADKMIDPYRGYTHVLKSADYTLTAADVGKWIWVDTDAVTITLPAVAGYVWRVGNVAAFGVAGFTVAPNASDNVRAAGVTAADNKGLINTKATARRGDFIEIGQNDANGWCASPMVGTWARVA